MLEPPYAWERRDNIASEEWLRSAGPGHMARVGRCREDGREHPGCARTPARSVPRGRMNPED